ncbi:uncharacterized protein PAC_00399 [Phialocephala subalpina]|uniref:Pentatricopeptide repeat protein n=1 Tax=Phialocephala subalpina TaxID=576137 RepID=A0A1L7WCN5_9HELO|nr:uncharacterized protein PAC_00399 [Phialocephala subalpina]
MPPPQHLLSTRLRGFVCKSCLSKLRAPRGQRIPWTSRTFASDDRPRRKKGGLDLPHGTIRYFEQTPDGVRTEIKDGDDDGAMDKLREKLKEIEERTGKTADDLDAQDLDDILQEISPGEEGDALFDRYLENALSNEQGSAELGDDSETMSEEEQRMQNQLELINSLDVDNLSDEDRLMLRKMLLEPTSLQESTPSEGGAPGKSSILNEYTRTVLPVASFPAKYHGYLRHLEQCVNGNVTGLASQKRSRRRGALREQPLSNPGFRIKQTWKSYIMCRAALLSSPYLIPARFWEALWNILSEEDICNLDRMSHIKKLGDDMQTLRVDMSPDQRLLYIEAVFVDADQASAIQAWESMASSKMERDNAYWDLGTRMFCRHGLIDRAIDCAENVLKKTNDPSDFRLLLPIIGAVLKSDDEYSVQRAWALYIRLRFNFGNKINMEDYDSLISMFMDANRKEQALAVFKDMMLTNDVRRPDRDSISRYTISVGKNAVLSSLRILPAELDWQEFKTVDKLPSNLDNPIFFASWMKKLIGDGELDSAEKVYNLMQERGIRPSSISINGLIGAWYRSKKEKYHKKADALAWQMIEERKLVVAMRDVKFDRRTLEGPVRVVMTTDMPNTKPVTLVPYATIETFSILLQQYRKRQKFTLIPSLFEALNKARIKPNVGFMNQMLSTDMKAETPAFAWKTYRSLTDLKKSKGSIVQPDFETYLILWECMARAHDPLKPKAARRAVKLPSPRVIFGEMMQHLKWQKGPLPNDLYQTIIMCFCLNKDQAGTAVALEALKHVFGNYPTENTARSIVLQLARVGFTNEHGFAPRRLNVRSSVSQGRIHSVTAALNYLKEQRAEVLSQQGIDFDALEGEAKLEETILLLSQLLRYSYEHKPVKGRVLRKAPHESQTAALLMGVRECIPWKALGDSES